MNLVFIDTSVWIDFFRGKSPTLSEEVKRLLDEDRVALAHPVKIEILSGASKRDLPRLRRIFSALPLFTPSEQLWKTLEDWAERSAGRGERFGVADMLIAAIAAENGDAIWSLDGAFARMARFHLVNSYSSSER